MARLLDETFLKVHPATALWWQQRDLCRRCANYRETPSESRTKMSVTQRCALRPNHRGGCVEMRAMGAPCGPRGALFVAREERAA